MEEKRAFSPEIAVSTVSASYAISETVNASETPKIAKRSADKKMHKPSKPVVNVRPPPPPASS
jgi:hypothetical protein